ncbi:MAG: hypothetical protein H8D23_25280 [Candidatus Brocadiales bacterium]|nr:hypothetical protein [Candidatus Brocadiales bacterium]
MGMSGEEMYEKFNRNMGNAKQDIIRGVQSTTKSQSGNAIKAKQKYIDNLQKSIAKNSWEQGLKDAGDEKWRNNFISKGVDKIQAGIAANKPHIVAQMQKVSQIGEEIKNQVANMPKVTEQDSIDRVVFNMRFAKKAWGKE